MNDRIAALSDAEALRLVRLVGDAHAGSAEQAEALTPDLRAALLATFEVAPSSVEAVSEGDLARTALLLYAEDPVHREAVAALLDHPPPEQFGVATTLALTTAVLLILQTHVRFYRDKEGKWTLRVEKKPTSNALLQELVQKLLGTFPGKGP